MKNNIGGRDWAGFQTPAPPNGIWGAFWVSGDALRCMFIYYNGPLGISQWKIESKKEMVELEE
jgi:hypothetical protein